MSILNILWKNIKWRYHHVFTIIVTLLQPLLWLILYSSVASQTLQDTGIENYTAFIFPGLIFLISFSACSSSGMMNYMTKNDGSFYRILIAPIHRSSIIIGQILEAIFCTFIEVAIMFIFCLFLSVNISLDILGFLIIVILIFQTAFFIACIAYSMSLILPNEMLYETLMTAIVLPIFFLSSALFPTDRINGILKIIIQLNPFTYVINSIRTLMLTGTIPITDVSFSLVILIIFSFLAFLFAINRLNKETDL